MNIFSLGDNLYIINEKLIVVNATIAVVATDKGGRDHPFTNGFRPNHNFGSQDDRFFFIGQIKIPKGEWVYPGETRDLSVTFLNAPGLYDLLKPGRIWRIQEGSKLIGTGTVIAIE